VTFELVTVAVGGAEVDVVGVEPAVVAVVPLAAASVVVLVEPAPVLVVVGAAAVLVVVGAAAVLVAAVLVAVESAAAVLVVEPAALVLVSLVVLVAAVSATVAGVVELALAVPAELDPFSPPQPASAIARLLVNRVATIRPTTRSAFLIKNPRIMSSAPVKPDEGISQGLHERAAAKACRFSRGGAIRPGNPAVIGRSCR
jgi:hypothetical protein